MIARHIFSQNTFVEYYGKCLNFALIKQVSYLIYFKTVEITNFAKVICLKAVCSADANVARQAANTKLRAVSSCLKNLTCLRITFYQTCEYILYNK